MGNDEYESDSESGKIIKIQLIWGRDKSNRRHHTSGVLL